MKGGPWLVTGASGFLGRHLLQQIRSAHPTQPILALVRSREEWDAMEWTGAIPLVDTVIGAVTEPESWAADARMKGLGGIFHLAALVRHCQEDAPEVYRTNIEGTLAMVQVAARARCRMVFVSTSGTVGCFREPGHHADEDAPYCAAEVAHWPYYDSKVKAEQQSRQLAGELGVELVVVRPPVLLGPGDHRFRSSNHVSRFLRGKLPFLIEGGMHFADVRDVAAALVRVMDRETVRPVYHLPGTVCSIAEFYRMVAKAAEMPPPRLVVPYLPALWIARITHGLGLTLLPAPELVEMAAHHWSMESKYSAEELGYRSREGTETLDATVKWLRNHPPP